MKSLTDVILAKDVSVECYARFGCHLKLDGIVVVDSPLMCVKDQITKDSEKLQLADVDFVAFPLFDAYNQYIGNCYRTMHMKYCYGKLTKSYSNILYGYPFAVPAAVAADAMYLVEGMYDAMTLQDKGLANTVCSLGAALSWHQAWLLARVCKTIFAIYDPDYAGEKATAGATEILKNLGCEVVPVTIDTDPDEYVTKHGVEEFKKVCEISIISSKLSQ